MEPTDLSLKTTSKKPRYTTSSPRDVTNLDLESRTTTSSKDLRRSAFQPVAPSTTGIVPPPLPYPAFLAGQAASHVLTGTISVYSDILQHQLNTAQHTMNTSFSHSGTEDDPELSPNKTTRHKNNNNKKQTKSKSTKVIIVNAIPHSFQVPPFLDLPSFALFCAPALLCSELL